MTKDGKLRVLVVEDDPTRVEVFEAWLEYLKLPCDFHLVWTKSAGSAIGLLRRDRGRVYSGILLDHDLHQQNLTGQDKLYSGKDVVKTIIECVDSGVPVMVHSTNPKGGPEMANKLRGAGFSVEFMPFHCLRFPVYQEWLSYVCEASQA